MVRVSTWLTLCAAVLVSACVTINVYFPAAAAEKAADRIIDEVWGKDARDKASGGVQGSMLRFREHRVMIAGLVNLLVPAAEAQQANLDISSPSIKAIEGAMKVRHDQMRPFYDSGAIGLTEDGLVAVRDPKAVPLKDRQRVNALVADDNRDRKALYEEIARANGHPEWEDEIRATFARRWVQKAPSGWWYRTPSGWKKK